MQKKSIMKRISSSALLLLAFMNIRSMQRANSMQKHAPNEIHELCKNEESSSPEYHCRKLREFFFCAYAMNSQKTDAIEKYCRNIYLTDGDGDDCYKTGIPSMWNLAYTINELGKRRNKSPEEIVDCIEKTQIALNALRKPDTTQGK